jgi:hypothetical protein
MFYSYDTTKFPNITIQFTKELIQDEHMDTFLEEWKQLYSSNKPFTMIFDTTEMSSCIPLFRHSFKVIQFIQHLKTLQPLLEKSIIIVNNNAIKNILSFVFQLESPVCPIYITEPLDVDIFLKQIEFSDNWYGEDVIKVEP